LGLVHETKADKLNTTKKRNNSRLPLLFSFLDSIQCNQSISSFKISIHSFNSIQTVIRFPTTTLNAAFTHAHREQDSFHTNIDTNNWRESNNATFSHPVTAQMGKEAGAEPSRRLNY